jgi:glucose dehydrogenase
MDYEPFKVEYTAGQPYVGATLSMFPAPGSHGGMGNFIAWDAGTGKIVLSPSREVLGLERRAQHRRRPELLRHARGLPEVRDKKDINKELFKFKTPSGIIGNVFTYEHKGKQYIGVFSGIGGWAGIGMAAGLEKDHRRPRRRGRLQGTGEVHRAGWFADRVRPAELNRLSADSAPP